MAHLGQGMVLRPVASRDVGERSPVFSHVVQIELDFHVKRVREGDVVVPPYIAQGAGHHRPELRELQADLPF